MTSLKRIKRRGIISTDRLPKFEHFNAETIEEALLLLKTYGEKAVLIAGGTELLRELKRRVQPTQPEAVINIKSISRPGLNYVEEDAAGLKIGSAVTLHRIEVDELIRGNYSLLAQAAHLAGIPQSRNVGTIGGNLSQHVWCCYYRASGNAFFCRRKGGDKCHAIDGDHRYHAILGAKGCVAVCPSGLAPALVALGAKVKISGTLGDRIAPVAEFFTPLGNALRPGDILTEVHLPAPAPDTLGSYIKVGIRNAFDTAIVSIATVVRVEDGLCRSASIVLGEVSPLPWRAVKAEKLLVGERLTRSSVTEAARAAVEGAVPLRMNAYKLDIVQALVKRALPMVHA